MKFLWLTIISTILLVPSSAKAEWVNVASDKNATLFVYDGKTTTGASQLGKMAEFFIKIQVGYAPTHAKVTAVCRSHLYYLNELNPDGSLRVSKPVNRANPGSLIKSAIEYACK